MSENKLLEIQQQVRQDNEYLNDYLRDLNNWEDDIKQKDNKLRSDSGTGCGEQILPPVRNHGNQQHRKKRRKKKKTDAEGKLDTTIKENGKTGEKNRIKAYDYRSWDKFDVDKACADLDSDGGEKGSSTFETDSEDEREMIERRKKIQEAIAVKDKGNALFKQGNYDQSLICYSAGMEADPTNSILPANRAMALLKLKRFKEAESDCDKAVSLDCTYVKAYARRGAARIELGKLEDSKKDFQQVLNLEPSNKQAASEIKRIDRLLRERDKRLKQAQEPSNIVHAIEKPEHLRSNKPLKRIHIEEIGMDTDDQVNPPRFPSDATKEQHSFQKINASPAMKSDAAYHEKSIKAASNVPDKNNELRHKSAQNRKNDTAEISAAAETTTSEPFHRASSPPSVPAAPVSSYQLQADWRQLTKYPQQLYQYFKQIEPEKLPSLFQQSLDSSMLTKILNLLQQHYIPNQEPIYEVLMHLSAVRRFDMNVMFMSKKEKQVAVELIEYCRKSKSQTAEELKALTMKYGL